MKRVVIMAGVVAIAELCLVALFVQSSIKDFLWGHPWLHSFIVGIPGLIVPILAYLELRHSSEANTLRADANTHRDEANRLRERAIVLQQQVATVTAERDGERNEALQKIATGVVKAPTQAEMNAATLRKYLKAKAFVTEGQGYWGNQPEIADVSDSNIVTLFSPKDFSSSQAWFVQVHCNDLEISEFPQGGCPVRIRVLKRYGDAVQLGEITRWEDRLQPSATPTFPEGDVAHYSTYRKPGSSDTRALYIHASKDGANSFLLKASTGERLTGDNKDISKKFMAMHIDYVSEGFTRAGGGGGGGSNLHKLFVS